MASDIQSSIVSAVKDAMRAKDKARLGVLRMVTAEFKRIEVDERIELDDARVLGVLDKMVKQRKDAAQQFSDAGRQELADNELFEIEVIKVFLPEQLSEQELQDLVDKEAQALGATSMADMGKLMGAIKPQVQGRADMGLVSKLVKAKLN